MIAYFGYGSNINFIALKAKGVVPELSERGVLEGWQLVFNVQHWFKHEGGMGNIVPSGNLEDAVEGVVHFIDSNHLQALDAMESYGVGYDRIEVEIMTETGVIKALTYIGLPDFIDNSCLPTERYLNIIIAGATAAGLSARYIQKLVEHPTLSLPHYPNFEPSNETNRTYNEASISGNTYLTALAGFVFDMQNARDKLQAILPLFGGKDMTLFHLKRHNTSDGNESITRFLKGDFTEGQSAYINAYLNEYNKEFEYVGRFKFD